MREPIVARDVSKTMRGVMLMVLLGCGSRAPGPVETAVALPPVHEALPPSKAEVRDDKGHTPREWIALADEAFNQTKLVDGVIKQVAVIRGIVGDDVPITGVLCFIESDRPLIAGAFTTRGVEVIWPKRLYRQLVTVGPHAADLEPLHQTLAAALPPA